MSITPLTPPSSSLPLIQNTKNSSETPDLDKITAFIPKPPEKPEGKSLKNRVSQFENCEEKSSSKIATTHEGVPSTLYYDSDEIPEYFPSSSYYASYKEIEEAIKPWGKIEAVIQDKGKFNTMFIVSFKEDIQIQITKECPYYHRFHIPRYGSTGLDNTPFDLRGMYSNNGCSYHNCILSKNLTAFSLKGFKKNKHDWDPAINKASNTSEIARLKKLDHTKKKKELLKSVKDSGLSLLEKGVAYSIRDSERIKNPSIETIIQNYEDFSWKVTHRAK